MQHASDAGTNVVTMRSLQRHLIMPMLTRHRNADDDRELAEAGLSEYAANLEREDATQ